ncbi:tetratricopeptide repeat protein [Acidobacteria bacterium AB60]|nr:tetratricopeptide repeat protein [Acidobacteria bacterium AB60]
MLHLYRAPRILGWLAAITATVQIPLVEGQLQSATPQAVTSPQFKATPEQVGDSLMAHQRYQAAIEAYKNAPQDSSEIWNKMGIAYQLMLNVDDAARSYQKALKLDPKNSVAINNMGSVYMAKKEFGKAERAYREALKLDPKSALIHKNLGTAQLSEKKYKKGWESYQEALRLDPAIFEHSTSVRVENPASIQDRGAMNYYMAKSCVKAGMVARAIDYLRMALNEGFTTPKKILADAELASLKTVPAFQQLMASQGVYLSQENPAAVVRQ